MLSYETIHVSLRSLLIVPITVFLATLVKLIVEDNNNINNIKNSIFHFQKLAMHFKPGSKLLL